MPTPLTRQYPSKVLAKASQTAALATATAPAGSSHQRYTITGVDASYSAAQVGLLQLKDDTTVIWEGYVHNAESITFDSPIEGSAEKAFTAELGAGAAGVVGKVNLRGYLY
jgi:hypothetical protein